MYVPPSGAHPGAAVVLVFLTWNETGVDATFTARRLRRAAQHAHEQRRRHYCAGPVSKRFRAS